MTSCVVQDKPITFFQVWHKALYQQSIKSRYLVVLVTFLTRQILCSNFYQKPELDILLAMREIMIIKFMTLYQAIYIRLDVIIDKNVVKPTTALIVSNILGNIYSANLHFLKLSLPLIYLFIEANKTAQISNFSILIKVSTANSSLQMDNKDIFSESFYIQNDPKRIVESNLTSQIFQCQLNKD